MSGEIRMSENVTGKSDGSWDPVRVNSSHFSEINRHLRLLKLTRSLVNLNREFCSFLRFVVYILPDIWLIEISSPQTILQS